MPVRRALRRPVHQKAYRGARAVTKISRGTNPEAVQITGLLAEWGKGDPEALESLIPRVFDELRSIALRFLHRERPDHTLQPTALVNEVWLRLHGSRKPTWRTRAEFYQFASVLMRRLLVDYARTRQSKKRGEGLRLTLSDELLGISDPNALDPAEILDVDRGIQELRRLDPRAAKVVRLRYFIGLTVKEIADSFEVAERTVLRDWAVARRFLAARLRS